MIRGLLVRTRTAHIRVRAGLATQEMDTPAPEVSVFRLCGLGHTSKIRCVCCGRIVNVWRLKKIEKQTKQQLVVYFRYFSFSAAAIP